MPDERKDGIGLAPYPSPESVQAKIESARRWRNDTVRSAVVGLLQHLAHSMRAHGNEAIAFAPSANPIRPALSPDRATALLWRSAMAGALLAGALCGSAFVDQDEGTFVAIATTCLESEATTVARLKPLVDRTAHGATMATTGRCTRSPSLVRTAPMAAPIER